MCESERTMIKLSPRQSEMLSYLASGTINYSYSYFFTTAKALIRKGLIKYRPKSSPRYVLTPAGDRLIRAALKANEGKGGCQDMEKQKIIIAGSVREYEEYLREQNLTPETARYCTSCQSLHMIRNAVIIKYGTWYKRPDIHKLEGELTHLIRDKNCTLKEVS